jgi:hypothetical protein
MTIVSPTTTGDDTKKSQSPAGLTFLGSVAPV